MRKINRQPSNDLTVNRQNELFLTVNRQNDPVFTVNRQRDIRHSRSSLNYWKKGQLAQLVRESDLFFRVKRQIKTVLTNVVVGHVKSRMSNAKTRQR